MPDTRFADISEWQDGADLTAYRNGGYDCLILRAHSGYRVDNCFWRWRDLARGLNFTALGFYQYVVASRDTPTQAREFCSAVGALRPNEFAIYDSEEGSGDQTARVNDWFSIVDPWAGCPGNLYASLSWFRDHLGGVGKWANRPRWMAAYSSSEPSDPHEYWQNTDSAGFPGLGSKIDGNIFHGTSQQFLTTARKGSVAPPVSSVAPMALLGTTHLAQNKDGRMEEFIETASGEIKHRYQNTPGGSWVKGWFSLGQP
jgi:GH25 family lysozyme M1 (1,4-beta-N-acetylmuramidase)